MINVVQIETAELGSGQPSTDEVISNAYICQVRNTVNWIHAIAASPYGHNAIVRFT